jgi:hypothetical protein
MIVSELDATPSVGLAEAEGSGDGPAGEERRLSKASTAVDSISTCADSSLLGIPVSFQSEKRSDGSE